MKFYLKVLTFLHRFEYGQQISGVLNQFFYGTIPHIDYIADLFFFSPLKKESFQLDFVNDKMFCIKC